MEENRTTQDWIMMEKIFDNGIIKLKNSKYVKIIKVKPINFNLKSNLEKEAILNSYKIFLKTCNFDIQILIQSSKENLNKNIQLIKENLEKENKKYLNKLADDYFNFIQKFNSIKNSSSKNFYIIISENGQNENNIFQSLNEKYFKIKECLFRCGNIAEDINSKKDIKNILNVFLNSRIYLKQFLHRKEIKIFIDILKKENKDKKIDFYEGTTNINDEVAPAYINLRNPRYIEIDNIFYSGLIVVNYYREQNDILLKSILETNINMNLSIFYEKQDQYKTIKDLTYHIGNVGVDISGKNKNREDIDIAIYTYNDAKYIRKEMQVNNEDLYFLYIYVDVFADNLKDLKFYLNNIEGLMQSKGLQTRRANFREEQIFRSCLPIMENDIDIKNSARRNVLTSGLVSTYPFITSSIFDEEGIFIGKNIYNNSLIFVDRYNTEKYRNANMCIFGTSGAGKSFYTKLLILRYRLMGIEQYVIDPEREYVNLAKELNGTEIKIGPSSNTFVNVFDIREESLEDGEKGYLATKIAKLIGFFNLIFGELDEEEKAILEEKIIELYSLKNINFDDESLFIENKNNIISKKFKSSFDMPILEEFYEILKNDERTKKFSIKLIPFIKGSLNFFNNYTNIELDNKLIIADVYELGEENLKFGIFLFTELFWDKIKINRKNKKAIYLDEIWRLIGVTSNKEVASFIYKIFKTIRKYGGSAVAITQDVSDLFSLENGIYGKSILNNSSIKSFFLLEEENIKVLSENVNLSEKEKIEIKSLKRGESLMFIGDNHVLAKVECSEKEKEVLEGDNS